MYRVEDKYYCSEKDMIILESRFKTIMQLDANANGLPYRITSLYFDDYYDSHLCDSEDGVSQRNKYRIRIYNGSFDVVKLEVKYKLYNRVYKVSRQIDTEDVSRLMLGECIKDNNVAMDNPVSLFNLAIKQDLLRPKVIIDYERNAYVYPDGNVRITFDRNVRASNDVGSFLKSDNLYFEDVKELNRIVEVKYDEFLPGFIGNALELGNMNQIAYSKYKLCREQLEGK